MQQSSSSIANLAAALAKAQIALVNPEKSLVATIRSDRASGTEQTFRFAPLSSGLEIVRKTLGEYEIATVQTTAIDQGAGIVNLTTVLAHSSGEWIASDWPVCALSEMGTPHRMGKALTFARRYGLFTLAGIAGEDDLDAPDLTTPAAPTSVPKKPKDHVNSRLNGQQQNPAPPATLDGDRPRKTSPSMSAKPVLRAEESGELRDRLLAELCTLSSDDDAALWAHRSLPQKNLLIATDAHRIEEAFRSHIMNFTAKAEQEGISGEQVKGLSSSSGVLPDPPKHDPPKRARPKRIAGPIDKSVLALPEPRRLRDQDHVRYVAKQPCLVCGRQPSDTHHLRFAQSRALGRKVSDEFTVPLCRGHHREVHRCDDEAMWWQNARIDPSPVARALWLTTHPLPAITEKTVEEGATATTVDLFDGRNDRPAVRDRKSE
jgi:hypothetical protein